MYLPTCMYLHNIKPEETREMDQIALWDLLSFFFYWTMTNTTWASTLLPAWLVPRDCSISHRRGNGSPEVPDHEKRSIAASELVIPVIPVIPFFHHYPRQLSPSKNSAWKVRRKLSLCNPLCRTRALPVPPSGDCPSNCFSLTQPSFSTRKTGPFPPPSCQ